VQSGVPGVDAASASAQILVQQALGRWLAGLIAVQQVNVLSGPDVPEGQLVIEVRYRLLETQQTTSTTVRVI